ncbi:hypothetical protein Ac2012v2_004627 [Leucoagaricus gongylophorus]
MQVKWLNHSSPIDWPGSNASLALLRALLAARTHLSSFVIVHAGAVMKDDAAPLSEYGLTPSSTIVLVAHDSPLLVPAPSDEIQSELTSVRSLVPEVHAFLAALNSPAQSPPSTQDHARLTEHLLQCLLRLDAINTDTARAHRKTAVREAQQLLDAVDDAWTTYSASKS